MPNEAQTRREYKQIANEFGRVNIQLKRVRDKIRSYYTKVLPDFVDYDHIIINTKTGNTYANQMTRQRIGLEGGDLQINIPRNRLYENTNSETNFTYWKGTTVVGKSIFPTKYVNWDENLERLAVVILDLNKPIKDWGEIEWSLFENKISVGNLCLTNY
ncbi:MAG: hypothetical protein WCX97_01575 [Candidatus Magasanikbacteria bacterium]|jgi:hypothetical protein